jgi:hypothetical protein
MGATCQSCGQPIDPAQEVCATCLPLRGGAIFSGEGTLTAEVVGLGSVGGDPPVAERIAHVRAMLAAITTPSPTQPDRDAMVHQLHDVYVRLQSMRDACLKKVPADQVDAAINADRQIRFAMDLGNAVKHGTPLKQSPRSGHQPAFGNRNVTRMDGMWTFHETVLFDGQAHPGVAIAQAALAAWEQLARRWGLV